jgi:tetratricopeptide (TPR) repeat protein
MMSKRSAYRALVAAPGAPVLFCLLAGALVLAPARSASAQEGWRGGGRILGSVKNEEGKGVKDAVVALRHAEAKAGPDLKTDGRGNFTAAALRAGTWNIEVRAEGYLPSKGEVMVGEGEGEGEAMARVEFKLVKDRSAEQAKELNKLLAKGNELFGAGKFAEARAEYMKIIAVRPDEAMVHTSIAYTYGREGNHAEAIKHFDEAIKIGTVDSTGLMLATTSALSIDQPEKAREYVAKIDDATVQDPQMFWNLGLTFINKGHKADGVKMFERLIARFPESAEAKQAASLLPKLKG